MTQHLQNSTYEEATTFVNVSVNQKDLLASWGFNTQEIASLLWLQQWYQSGGSDRASIVRHLEFLKMLVDSGELEL